MKPKFVYFDVGGVVIMDFSGTNKWQELKNELGITPDKDQKFEEFWNKYEKEICISRETDSLIPLIKEEFKVNIPDNYSLLIDGFVKRFEQNKSIWPVIEKIAKQSKVGLLTNQYLNMFPALKSRGLLPNISWDVILDSSIEKIQKPDPQIFQLAQERAGFKGQEILFVENSPKHINAALTFNWQTFLYNSSNPENSSKELLDFYRKL